MKYIQFAPVALLVTSLTALASERFDMNTIHSKFENEKHSNTTTKKAEFEQYVLNALVVNEESRWNYDSPLGTAVTVKYAFAGEDFGYPYSGCCVERDFKDYEKEAFVNILKDISKVAGVTFEEVDNVADTNIIFTISTSGSGAEFPPTNANDATRPRLVSISDASTLFYLNPDRDVQPYERPNTNDVDFKHDVARSLNTIIHEMGHALGMKHPFYKDSNGDFQNHLDAGEANKLFTVMEYNMPQSSSEMFHPTTFKKYDVLTLQHLYGAPATPVVNDHYEFDDTFDYHQMIVDADGLDTLSVVNSTRNNVLDLRSGAFSSIAPNPTGFYDADAGGKHMNRSHNSLSIGFDTVIEDATGGSGNDTLIGNDVANTLTGNDGDDFLTGHGENDELDGGLGFDTAVYLRNRADYTVTMEDGYVTINGSEGLDKLQNIEAIQFADETVVFNNAPVITLPESIELRAGQQTTIVSTVTDADGDELIYTWTQVGGDALTLANTDTKDVTVTAPSLAQDTTYTVQLAVSDGKETVTDTVVVNVKANNAPVITISDAQTVNENTTVNVSVEATDADNDNLTYRWVVTGGNVTLSGSSTSAVSFNAPNVSADTTLTFEVFVSDGFAEVSDSTTVTVKNIETATPQTPTPSENSSSGGSFSWFLLLMSSFLAIRRKITKMELKKL